ncbi:MAG: NAD(P)-dependent oxidoreductase [Candidatus Woesearchaeota archaeon]
MEVFVTGANGLLGTALVRKLAKRHKVTAFVLKGTPLKDLNSIKNVAIKFGNILDQKSVEDALGSCTVAYHLAAAVHVPDVMKNKLFMLNVKGTENVLNACIKSKKVKRLIYASTIAVYGKVKDEKRTVINESYPIVPVLNYGKTKLIGERIVKGLCPKHNIKYIIIRPSKIYGPGDNSLLPLLKLARMGLSFTIGKGDGMTMPVYVDDAAEAFYLALDSKKANTEYIATGPDAVTKRQFVAMLAKTMGKKPRKIRIPSAPILVMAHIGEKGAAIFNQHLKLTQKLEFFLSSRRYSIEKARKELKYSPSVSVEQMVFKTAEWYRNERMI